jgi:hypothetical protein
MKQTIFLFVTSCLIYSTALSQNLTLSGENYLLLNGERFKNQKVLLTKANGDWFATSKDAHGTISFYGNHDGRQLQLDIEWDGKNEQHIITNDIRHDGKRTGDFIITMSDKAVYGDGLNAYPEGEDEIKISILKIDETSISGEMKGVIEQGRDKVVVAGVFNLKKITAAKQMVNSSYKDCDNVIHDKLIGAEGRSPSECEAKYDLDVRTTIHDALTGVVEKFQSNGWEVEKQTDLEPLFLVGRGSEKNIFNTSYQLEMKVSQTSPTYAGYYKKFNELSEKLKEPSKEGYEQFMKFGREMNGALNSNIYTSVNNHGISFYNFKGGAKVTKLSNIVYTIQSSYAQSRTGGGEEESVDVTFLLVGNWKQPVIEKSGDGGEEIKATAILNPSASHLQTQNIFIRIECNASVANDIIKELDLQKLQSMINR